MDRRLSPLPRAETSAVPEWAITFADMMTLILIYFVLMLSFSNLDLIKYRSLARGFQAAFGGKQELPIPPPVVAGTPVAGDPHADAEAEQVLRELSALGKSQGPGGPVEVTQTEKELRLRIDDRVMFDLGSANLRPEAQQLLARLTPILRRYPFRIEVEGHTDDLPIRNAVFPSNWELSAARAGSVVRALITRGGLAPDKLVAVGLADTHPLAPNMDDAARARNRRVEFLLVKPASATPAGESVTPDPAANPAGTGRIAMTR